MLRFLLVVAALLLTDLTGIAAAADNSEHPSKNAQKLTATLNSMGINNPDVQGFIDDMNARIDGGYFNFTEQSMMGGTLALRYPVDTNGAPRRLELNYSPDDSHMAVTACTNSVMVTYRLTFP